MLVRKCGEMQVMTQLKEQFTKNIKSLEIDLDAR